MNPEQLERLSEACHEMSRIAGLRRLTWALLSSWQKALVRTEVLGILAESRPPEGPLQRIYHRTLLVFLDGALGQ